MGGRQLRAKYEFAGATPEIERTLPLGVGEEVLLHGVMRLRGRGLPRPAVLRLTGPRLVVLVHFAIHSDLLWELPRSAIDSVDQVGSAVHITWSNQQGGQEVLRLTRWTGRVAPDDPIEDLPCAARTLREWLSPPGTEGDSGRIDNS